MTEQFPADDIAQVRRRTAADVVSMLAGIVRRLRTPLLALIVAPLVSVLVLAGISAVLDSPDRQFGWTVAAVGLIPPLWLSVRRRQLLTALEPSEVAMEEFRTVFSAREIAEQVRSNLVVLRGQKIRPRTLARGLWKGITLGIGLQQRFTEVPRLQPFLPGRLRGLAFLGAACLGTAVIVGALDVLLLVLWALNLA